MNNNFMGFMENTITFECDETVKTGVPVKVIESGKVTACGEGDKICGVCMNVRDGFASVQVKVMVMVRSLFRVQLTSAPFNTVTLGIPVKLEMPISSFSKVVVA